MRPSRGRTDAGSVPFLALVDGALRPPAATLALPRSLALRLRVRLHRLALTRRPADAADPLGAPELALRARQLTAPRELRDAVTGLERVLREADGPRPTGVARTVLLLVDGCGPLYTPSHPGTLARRAYRAADTV